MLKHLTSNPLFAYIIKITIHMGGHVVFFSKEIGYKSYIRIFNVFSNKLDFGLYIYANKNIIAKDLGYGYFSDYTNLCSGEYNIEIYANKNKKNQLFSKRIFIEEKKIYTLAIIEKDDCIQILSIEDIIRPIPDNALLLRLGHLSSNSPTINITLPDKSIIFKNTGYTNITRYTPLRPSTLTLEVRDSNTSDILLTTKYIRFKPNRCYSLYVINNNTKSASLKLLLALDGNSYLQIK